MGLETYYRKRNFSRTPEPKGKVLPTKRQRFVVQEHHASHLHFDFRLEIAGVLKSWSIPKGPSLDPGEKRLAVTTEDHPIDYLDFEGHIAEGNYGAGDVRVWDIGEYEPVAGEDPEKAYKAGKLTFTLRGDKLHGEFHLIRTNRDRQWLLIKSRDEFAEPGWTLKTILPVNGQSTKAARANTGRTKEKIAKPTKNAGKTNASAASSAPTKKRAAKQAENEKPVAVTTAFKTKTLSGDMQVKVKKHTVALTSLDKVYWPEDGYTKGDLLRYYYEVADTILPYLKDRPLILKRYPNGITKNFFFQHDVEDAPEFARTITLDVPDMGAGHKVAYLIGGTLETLLYTTNLGAIEQHPWLSRTRSLDHPDWIVFDLDPGKDVQFETICEVAVSLRDVLGRLGLEGYAKTTGSRGIHVYVPIKADYSYPQVAEFAERVAAMVVREQPKVATLERSLKKRKRGQIYVDYLQNARGKSAAAPYSARPRAGAMVSTPLTWREVETGEIVPQEFTIKSVLKRIARKGDLFAPVLKSRQSLNKAMKGVDAEE
jgi:bifunctional non-homologous end joining protein LigD